jgi:serine/threonine protein kinase
LYSQRFKASGKQVHGGLQIYLRRIIARELTFEPFPSLLQNVFATEEDSVQFKIGDFGLSKLIETAAHATSPTTRSGRVRRRQELLLLEYNQSEAHNGERGPQAIDSKSSWQDPLTAGVGTASYAAPEQVASRSYGVKADVFSLGLILLELLCCFSTEHERIQTFHDCRHRRTLPNELDSFQTVARTILACTDPNPNNRPSAEDLVNLDIRRDVQECNLKEHPDIASLREQLVAKDRELVACRQQLLEKDRVIEGLRRQVSSMSEENGGAHPAREWHVAHPDAESASASTTSSEDGI